MSHLVYEFGVYNKLEHRQTLEGILYRLRVGYPWRDLPECFGLWNTIYRRFLLWSRKGILMRLFKTLAQNSDTEWEFIDGSYVKAHQHSTGAASEHKQVIALSRGGNTSKIHLAVDSYGSPIEFIIIGGDVHDSKVANDLIELLPQSDFVVADKGYDSEATSIGSYSIRLCFCALQQAAPRSILVLPPMNSSVDVNAPYSYLSTISTPLAEKGYYVFPVQ